MAFLFSLFFSFLFNISLISASIIWMGFREGEGVGCDFLINLLRSLLPCGL